VPGTEWILGSSSAWTISMLNKLTVCKTCGLDYQDFYPWGEDGKTPSFEICDCCGVTFGYEDKKPESAEKYRTDWLQSGAHWNNKETQPKNWSKDLALKNISK